MADDEPKPLVFISYSHKDEIYKDQVLTHLGGLSLMSQLEPWHDGDIGAGHGWYEEIEEKLTGCAVAVLLISANFLSSKFCMQTEMPILLERRRRQKMMIMPILVESCFLQATPWLNAIQMRPSKGYVIEALTKPKRNAAYTKIIEEIHGFLESDDARDAVAAKITESSQTISVIADHTAPLSTMSAKITAAPAKADTPYLPLPEDRIDLTRLPTSGMDVVGRDKELQFLNEAFDGDTLNVVSLRAWGGVGKSTLVNKWCEYLAADNFRGATRVFAWSFYSQGTNERVTSADAFIDEALRFFGDGDPTAGSPWSKGERLAELVGKEKALLFLDGMEPLQDEHQGIKDPALARLAECLAENNAGLCLITTREPVKEFADFPDTTHEVDLEQLSKEAGRALLRIKGLRATDDLLEQISEAFGNHALALNLLASFLQLAGSPVEGALKIPDLSDVKIEEGKHPRRVMAAFAGQLGEGPELDLLYVMGLFDRPAYAGCIAALRKPAVPGLTERLSVLDEVGWRTLLDKLRSCGLLAGASRHAPDDLDAHPLVREHFGARFASEREDAWKAGHERLYEYLQTVPEKHQPDTLAEMAPLFQAVHHGCLAGHVNDVFKYLLSDRIMRSNKDGEQAYLLYKLGAFGSHLTILTSLFEKPFAQPSRHLNESIHCVLLHSAAFNLASLGRINESFIPSRKSLNIFLRLQNFSQAALSASILSQFEMISGNIQSSISNGILALNYAETSKNDQQRLIRRTNLAESYHYAADFDKARELFLEASQINENYLDEEGAYVRLYFRFGELHLSLGEPHNALHLSELGIAEIRRKWRRLLDIGLIYLLHGCSLCMLGDRMLARQALDRSVEVLRTSGQINELPKGLLGRARLLREMEEYQKSRRDLAETMRLATRCGMRLFQCDAHLEYARLALAEGNPEAALPHFQSADALVSECGYHRRDPEIADLKEKLGL